MIDYRTIYSKKIMDSSDGRLSYIQGMLKFGDALAAIGYAYGIPYSSLLLRFPQVSTNERFENMTSAGPGYTVQDQIDFIKTAHTRIPRSILEIGGGRLEVVTFLAELARQLGVVQDIVVIEPGEHAPTYLVDTAIKYFPRTSSILPVVHLINKPLHTVTDIDYSKFDTILMIESLEHILATEFDPCMEQIKQEFHGSFIVTNWHSYHPIAVGQYAPPNVHCRLVDDALYDDYASMGRVAHRYRSHLWIEKP
jgi:hypothetical protein